MISRWINKLLFQSKATKGTDVSDLYRLLEDYALKTGADIGNKTTVEGPFVVELSPTDYQQLGALLPILREYLETRLARKLIALQSRGYEFLDGRVVIAQAWTLDDHQVKVVRRAQLHERDSESDPYA